MDPIFPQGLSDDAGDLLGNLAGIYSSVAPIAGLPLLSTPTATPTPAGVHPVTAVPKSNTKTYLIVGGVGVVVLTVLFVVLKKKKR